ncbi:MAG: type IX secretion system sortase PorU, partial [Candidatus Zixiibacteriota bacterium]
MSMASSSTVRTQQTISFRALLCAMALSGASLWSATSASGVESRITLHDATQQGVSFTFHPHSSDVSRGFTLAAPPGSVATLSSARTHGARFVPHDERFSKSTGAVVEIGASSSVRGWRVVPITLRPRQGDILFDSITVTVSFTPAAGATASAVSPRSTGMSAPGAFGSVFAASMVNYENALTWSSADPSLARRAPSLAAPTPFDYASNWLKLAVTEDGLTRVDASATGLAGVSSNRVHMFYAGGEPLPALNQFARPVFSEIPIIMVDGGDGSFDAGDYLLFYGEAANRWRYPSDSAPKFVRNHYTDDNFFWLTADDNGFPAAARRMAQVDGTPAGAVGSVVASARRHIRLETDALLSRDARNDVLDYFNWYWTQGSSHSASAFAAAAIADPAQDDTTRYLAHIIAGSVTMRADGVLATPAPNFSQNFWSFKGGPLTDGLVSFDFSMSEFFSRGPFFDYLDVDYLAGLRLNQLQLGFSGPKVSQRREFLVDGATAALITLNIDNPMNPAQLVGGQLQAGQWRFAADLDSAGANRFYVADPAAYRSPGAITSVTTANLRADTLAQTDFIVVAPGAWEADLQRYMTYREARSSVTARFVPLDVLYDEFGFGSPDPSAIRDYLKYAFERFPSPTPSTALFVGDGSYDFRNLTGVSQNFVPPYTSPLDRGFASDDHYVYFDDFASLDSDTDYIPDSVLGVDMVPARWPVRNLSELNRVIDKTINYELNPELGGWRNEIILLADDEFGEFINESVHVRQTEELDLGHIPPVFLRNKIYLWDFPLNSLQERPTVNEELVRAINKGATIVNNVGHGNLALFAHERIFTLEADVPRLQNGARLPLVFTASCSIGFFDSPTTEGMAEELLRMNQGAIAVVSATRLVYSSANAEFNKVAFDQLFAAQDLTMAQAVFSAKLIRQSRAGTDNDRRYSFFGDPYLRLGKPEFSVRFTTLPDSLQALQPSVVAGTVQGNSGQAMTSFNGEATITIRDSKTTRNHKVLNSDGNVSADMFYDVNGPIVFRGAAPVINGSFSVTFIPSLDIAFGGADASISVYLSDTGSDASGRVNDVPVGSTIPSTTDNRGPQIQLNFAGRGSFASGDPITPGEEIIIALSDTSGINLSGAFGHSISLTVDEDVTAERDLTAAFVYDEGSFRHGEVRQRLDLLEPGEHTFKIKAWDNANNSSTLEFTIAARGLIGLR